MRIPEDQNKGKVHPDVSVEEGVLLPASAPRFSPILRGLASLTVFALTLTTLMPPGWADSTSKKDHLRVLQGKESTQVQTGLEEALTRRDFLKKTAGTAASVAVGAATSVAVGVSLTELLNEMATAAEPQGRRTSADSEASSEKAIQFLKNQANDPLFTILLENKRGGYTKQVVPRQSSRWTRLPVAFNFDAKGSEILAEAIKEEAASTRKPELEVSQRYYKAILTQQGRSFAYDAAAAVVGLVTAAESESNARRQQQLLSQAQQILEALVQIEKGTGRMGYSTIVAGPGEHDLSLQMGALAWAGEAFLTYSRVSKNPATAQKYRQIAQRLAKTILEFQNHTDEKSQATGLIRMGLRANRESIPWASTEYNIDAYFFLRDLGALTRNRSYTDAAERIAQGIERYLLDTQKKRFNRGFNDPLQALDANSWGALFLLARGREEEAQAVRTTIDRTFQREVDINGETLLGYAPYVEDSFIWSEGSFGVALLDRRLGHTDQAGKLETSLLKIQSSNGGFRYAYPAAWTKSEDSMLFLPFPGTAPTAWSIIARSSTFWTKAGLEEATIPSPDRLLQQPLAPPAPSARTLWQVRQEIVAPAVVAPAVIPPVAKMDLPSSDEVKIGRGKSFRRLESLLRKVAETKSRDYLQAVFNAIPEANSISSVELDDLRAHLIDALAEQYQISASDLINLSDKELRQKNQLRRAAGLPALVTEQNWESKGYLVKKALVGSRAVKAVVIARARGEDLMGTSEEATARVERLRQEGVDVTFLLLGAHSSGAYAQQATEQLAVENLSYLRSTVLPVEATHNNGYLTVLSPQGELQTLAVEHTTDPFVAWVKHQHGDQAAVETALSLESKEYLRRVRFAGGEPRVPLQVAQAYLENPQLQQGWIERQALDQKAAQEREPDRQQRRNLAKVGAALVAAGAVFGVAKHVQAQAPQSPDQLLTARPAPGEVQVQVPLAPSGDINANRLPARVEVSASSTAPIEEGPGVIAKIKIETPAEENKPLIVDTSQTPPPRVVASPANFARNPILTAAERVTNQVSLMRDQLREQVYGKEDGSRWTAANEPAKALLLPGLQVGYPLWKPEDLHLLGEDRVNALFQAIGEGASRQDSEAVFLYETRWPVTLRGAQAENGPVPEAVLAKIHRHLELAHQHGVKVLAMYSGTEGLNDPDTAVQHLNVAMGMGFDPEAIVTDIEGWTGEVWGKAFAQVHEAVSQGDPVAVSRARQEVLKAATLWIRVHEEILDRVIPSNRAHPETIPQLPEVRAFVHPLFVPILKLAVLWRQIEQAARMQGKSTDQAWALFDRVTTRSLASQGGSWTIQDLQNVFEAEGFGFDGSIFEAHLPERLKLVVMAYSYPNGNEANAVAQRMRVASADGFGGKLGLAVNLEPEDPSISLASRSARAGEIVGRIVETLQADSSTGFDGRTLYVQVADGWGLVDMAQQGQLTLPRMLSPQLMGAVGEAVKVTALRAFGVPARSPESQHRIPMDPGFKEEVRQQAAATGDGLWGGIIGIAPWYAAMENLYTWVVKDLAFFHPDTGPFGPELGGGQRAIGLGLGALASGEARITDIHLHLVKRDQTGKIVREVYVRHIPGKNSPVISDDVWDESELEVVVHRVNPSALSKLFESFGVWGPKLYVDMAAKVENRYSAPGDTPREEWTAAALQPWENEKTFRVKLPKMIAGSNAVTLQILDEKGRISEWIGPGHNTLYSAPYAPFVTKRSRERMTQSQKALAQIRSNLGKPDGTLLTASELEQSGRGDLLIDQQALGLNRISVAAGHQADVLVRHDLSKTLDPNETSRLLADLKFRGVTGVAVRVSGLSDQLKTAISLSDLGLDPFAAGNFQGPEFSDLIQFIREAHRHGLKVPLVMEMDELIQQARVLEKESQAKGKTRPNAAGDLIKLVLLANQQGKWNIDSIACDQPHPDETQRAQIERIVREGLDVSMVVIGPQGASSKQSQYATTVPLGGNPETAVNRVKQILNQLPGVSPADHRFAQAVVLEGSSLSETADWLAHLPTAGTDSKVMDELSEKVQVPSVSTLSRLGYPPSLIKDVLNNAPALNQEQLTQALHPLQDPQQPKAWAAAMVDAKAVELKEISEIPQVEHYGTPFENVVLSLYGIQGTPLILTEAQRSEVVPLVPKHLYQQDGTAWVGVQVTNPDDPARVSPPAVYDVWVHLDYPSWVNRPSAVHRALTLILKPGEKTPVWIQLEGLPQDQDSSVLRVRVLPRGAEKFYPGQPSTRSNEQQALELGGFVVHGTQEMRSSDRELRDEVTSFLEREENWRQAQAPKIKEDDPDYPALFDEHFKTYFGVGTPVQRVEGALQWDPVIGKVVNNGLRLRSVDPAGEGKAQATLLRERLAQWPTERLARIQQEPDRPEVKLLTAFYTGLATVALVGVPVAYFLGIIKGYYRARVAQRYYRESRAEAAQLIAGGGAFIHHPAAEGTRTYSVTGEESIRVAGIGSGFTSQPARLNPGQQHPALAMKVYGKHPVIVLDNHRQELSENIERTLVDPLGRRQTRRPADAVWEAERALFQRAVPRLIILNWVGAAAALFLGVPAAVVVAGVGISAAIWFGISRSPGIQQRIGHLFTLPARVASSDVANHPLTLTVVSLGAVAGAAALVSAFGIPIGIASIVTGVWFGVVVALARPTPDRLIGTLGIAGLGTAALLALLGATLPVWIWLGLSALTIAVAQKILMSWLEEELPMEGLLRGGWSALRFTIKWGVVAAALYGLFAVAIPFVWTGTWTLPFVGVAVGGLKGLLAVSVPAAALGQVIPTVGMLFIGTGLLINLTVQGLLFINRLLGWGTARRDGWSLTISGVGPIVLTTAAFWIWGTVPAATIMAVVGMGVLLMQNGALILIWTIAVSDGVRKLFERPGGVDRLAPDQRMSSTFDPAIYAQARIAATADRRLQRRHGITLGAPQAGEQLSPDQQRLVNWHYWRIVSIQQAQSHAEFSGLSRDDDQRRLINMYFTEHLKAHADTVIGEDSGTTIRTLLNGIWTGRVSEVVRAMRNEDRLVVIMPALILSLSWVQGDAWARMKKGQIWLFFWEVFRMTLVSYAVPLGFTASMINRDLRYWFTKDANLKATLTLRGDAGLGGYKEPIDYVLKVMGRWLVGHIFVLMRAYLGRRITRDAADLLLAHRWERKDGIVHTRINRLMDTAEQARAGGDLDSFRRSMGAAMYAALTGEKTLFFDVGGSEPPDFFEEETWNEKPDGDGLYDNSYYGPEFNKGTLAGTLAQRYDRKSFDGVHVYYPTRVVWNKTLRDWALSEDPGKFLIRMEHGGNPKSALADASLQYFEGRFTPVAEINPIVGLEEGGASSPPTHQLTIRFVGEENRFFPQIREAHRLIEEPRNRYEGIRRHEGNTAARQMAVLRHERLLGDRLGSDRDATAVLQGELGHDAYKDPPGRWYQFRLNLFGRLRDRYLGLRGDGRSGSALGNALRSAFWWVGMISAGGAIAWVSGSLIFGTAFILAPWLIAILFGTLIALSFIGVGIQDTILQGMKAHYESKFLEKSMRQFFRWTRASRRPNMDPASYRQVLTEGTQMIASDPRLYRLVAFYPHLMHPEGKWISRLGVEKADPAMIDAVQRITGKRMMMPTNRRALRLLVRREILQRVRAIARKDTNRWFAFREAFTRNTQGELMALGNDVASIQYHRSRNRDVFRAGDENSQFTVTGQEPLVRLMTALGVAPSRGDRTWARWSSGAFYGGVRMPSMVYSRTKYTGLYDLVEQALQEGILVEAGWGNGSTLQVVVRYEGNPDPKETAGYRTEVAKRLNVNEAKVRLVRLSELDSLNVPTGAIRRITPIEAYLEYGGAQTFNQFALAATHLQLDLEAVEDFLREEGRELGESLPDHLMVDEVNQYLAVREQRLGLPDGTFVRLRPADQRWLDKSLRWLKSTISRKGEIQLSAARVLPAWARRLLNGARWWIIFAAAIGGFSAAWLWVVAGAAWILGLPAVVQGLISMSRWLWPPFWIKAVRARSLEPYSDEVILLSILYGANSQQVVRGFTGQIVGLNWSVLDGLYDSSRWRVAVGTYLFPGTPIARGSVGERGGLMIHAPPVPFIAALRLLEEPPWLAPASGFNRLPTDAFELGESFAEDTLFGLVNLHRPTLNPTLNAFNIHKINYLFGQQELRKRDEATTRAIQLFKGIGMVEAIQHQFDHPMLAGYQENHPAAGAAIQRIFGWDPDANRPSGQSIFGMEAFRRDEVAAAGARGAGTLSYGYTGFTASNLAGRRVGPFAPGDTQALWTYRYYTELDHLLSHQFFTTMREIQQRHLEGLAPQATPETLLHGFLTDPFVVLSEVGVHRREAGLEEVQVGTPQVLAGTTAGEIIPVSVSGQGRESHGRAVVFNPKQVYLRQVVNPAVQGADWDWQTVRTRTKKNQPGRPLSELVVNSTQWGPIHLPGDTHLVLAMNSLQTNFWEPQGFLVSEGRLVAMPGLSLLKEPWVFVLDAEHPGLRQLPLVSGVPQTEEIREAIVGPILVQEGKDVSSSIRQYSDEARDPNGVRWDPAGTTAAFSAIGRTKDNRLIALALAGHPERGIPQASVQDVAQAMLKLRATEAILLGGSMDVQQWVEGESEPGILGQHNNPPHDAQRPLNAAILVYLPAPMLEESEPLQVQTDQVAKTGLEEKTQTALASPVTKTVAKPSVPSVPLEESLPVPIDQMSVDEVAGLSRMLKEQAWSGGLEESMEARRVRQALQAEARKRAIGGLGEVQGSYAPSDSASAGVFLFEGPAVQWAPAVAMVGAPVAVLTAGMEEASGIAELFEARAPASRYAVAAVEAFGGDRDAALKALRQKFGGGVSFIRVPSVGRLEEIIDFLRQQGVSFSTDISAGLEEVEKYRASMG